MVPCQPLKDIKLHFCKVEDLDQAEIYDELEKEAAKLGASIVSSSDECTVSISQFVESELDRFGRMASPFWLSRIVTSKKYEEPHQALDYPCPLDPIPSDCIYIISLSLFNADEREPLIAMITLAGAVYTADLSSRNTHLIVKDSANPSAKLRWAAKWSIRVRDQYWLERSFFQWAWEQ